jgi:uncharacterized membrane protein YagU involved in acid resistance
MIPFVRSPGRRPDPFKGAIAGLIGGLAASWVMSRFQYAVPSEAFAKVFGEDVERDEDDGEQSEPGTVKAASAISETVLDHELEEDEKEWAGEVAHYAMGGVSATIYGVAAELVPEITRDGGLLFGTTVWLLADETMIPAVGLSDAPWQYPASTHAYSLSSHLVYGLATEITRRLVRRWL